MSPTNLHFILDWDGTVTQKDTLDALINICKTIKPAKEVSSTWSHLTQAYLTDYEATLNQHLPNNHLPHSIPKERDLLLKLQSVEQRSLNRVSTSNIFSGLTSTILLDGARNALENKTIQFRHGYLDFERHLHSSSTTHDTRSFLSVNWSRTFILSCLQISSITPPTTLGQIYSNELQDLDNTTTTTTTGSTGLITGAETNPLPGLIISSNDKRQTLQALRESGSQPAQPIVYVGDSWTDFEALLEADVGICIRDETMTSTQGKLAEALGRCGVECGRHVSEVRRVERRRGEGEWNVVWARDFEEIWEWRVSLG